MTEEEAHAVVRVRALETAASPAWTDADAAWADEEARHTEGEHASFERWLATRARYAAERLETGYRQAGAGSARAALDERLRATARSTRVGWGIVLVAFALGVAGDVASGAQRINLLAPPLLAVLAWNLMVYVSLTAHWLALRSRTMLTGPRRWLQALSGTGYEWAGAAAPLHAARFGAVLHAAAFAVALGALLSLYLRGIAFEFSAGWDSTFLTATQVHAIVGAVLGPASHLSGIPLPDAARLEALRFSAGQGENAARWIHLHAITVALVVLLPRAVLAAFDGWRARRLARDFPLPLDDEYFHRLRRRWSAQPTVVYVVPYSYTLTPARRTAVAEVVRRLVSPRAMPMLAETVPLGGEDELAARLQKLAAPSTAADKSVPMEPMLCALFALTATPERESHGAFVRRLAEHTGANPERPVPPTVLIDESGFRERFAGPDFERRRAERRHAWEAMLRDGQASAVFVDLDDPKRKH